MMKMWNSFLYTSWPPEQLIDKEFLAICRAFIFENAEKICQARLRNNFALHLASVRDFGLLTSSQVDGLLILFESNSKPGGPKMTHVGGFEFLAVNAAKGTLL